MSVIFIILNSHLVWAEWKYDQYVIYTGCCYINPIGFAIKCAQRTSDSIVPLDKSYLNRFRDKAIRAHKGLYWYILPD